MKVTTIQYTVAPDRIDENRRFVRAVFSQLNEAAPQGLHYACLTANDGSFMHIVSAVDNDDDDALTTLQAFQEFRSGLSDRTIETPRFTEFEIVGNYRIF